MHKLYHILLILNVLMGGYNILGQDYIYKHLTTKDGLASSEVYQVFQDSKGYVWFATDNGVSRYNGYEFENFDINDGLPENAISGIYEDYKGKIWFIGINAKLSYYSDGEFSNYKYNSNLSQYLKQNPVFLKSGFYIDSIDNIYISIKDNGLFRIKATGQITAINNNPQKTYIAVIHELENGVKIPSTGGSWTLSHKYISYIKDGISNKIDLQQFTNDYPHHIYIQSINQNKFVYSKGEYVYLIENNKVVKTKKLPGTIIWMNRDKNNSIWLGLYNHGAICLKIEKDNFLEILNIFKEESISSIIQDNYGTYWFSTINNGIFQIESFDLKLFNKKAGLLYNRIESLEKQNNVLWVGYNNEISRMTENQTTHFTLCENELKGVKAIHYDKNKDQLVITTSKYLYLIKNNKIEEIKNNFRQMGPLDLNYFNATDITQDKIGGYWIGSGNGFYYLKDRTIEFDSRYVKNFFVRINSVFLDKNNTLWLGCKDGLRSFKNNQLQYLGDQFPKLKYRILDILEYKNALILATKGKGIFFFNDSNVIQISKQDGLNSNTITSIALSGNILFTGSLNGINKIILPENIDNKESLRINYMNELSDFEINQVKIYDSTLYAATNNGIISCSINVIDEITTKIPLILKKIEINGEKVGVNTDYRLEYFQNNISIKFEALKFSSPNQTLYKYQLKGLDDKWIYTTSREARYYHLPPGKYQFITMVRNKNGEWQKNNIIINFKIVPAIWQTLYFKISVGLLALSLLVLLFMIELHSTRYKARLKRNMYNYKLQSLLNQIKPHFIFNTLNSINKYILTSEKKSASIYLIRFSKLMRKILENSRFEQISLSEEIEAIKLYLEIETMRMKNKFSYSIEIDGEIDVETTKLPGLIIQPYIENSIWHGFQPSLKQGILKIKISKNKYNLNIDIIDNGIGRVKAIELANTLNPEKKSLASLITKNRLEVLSKATNKTARVTYTDLYSSNESIGTKVSIELPLIKEK